MTPGRYLKLLNFLLLTAFATGPFWALAHFAQRQETEGKLPAESFVSFVTHGMTAIFIMTSIAMICHWLLERGFTWSIKNSSVLVAKNGVFLKEIAFQDMTKCVQYIPGFKLYTKQGNFHLIYPSKEQHETALFIMDRLEELKKSN